MIYLNDNFTIEHLRVLTKVVTNEVVVLKEVPDGYMTFDDLVPRISSLYKVTINEATEALRFAPYDYVIKQRGLHEPVYNVELTFSELDDDGLGMESLDKLLDGYSDDEIVAITFLYSSNPNEDTHIACREAIETYENSIGPDGLEWFLINNGLIE